MPRARHAAVVVLAVVAVAVPVAAFAGEGGAGATPPGCVPGTVLRVGDARHSKLVDDAAVPAPAGWSSESGVELAPGDATEAPDAADDSWENATDAQEGDAAPGTGTGLDLAGLRELGIDLDATGALSYQGTPVRGLVQRHDGDVVSVYWSDTGTSYLLVDGTTVREVTQDEFPTLDAS
jgi:hypothetical protein